MSNGAQEPLVAGEGDCAAGPESLPNPWKVGLVVLLVVASFDGFVRLREQRLQPPEEWYHGRELVAQADRIRRERLPSDVIFVGTSMVQQDVRVEIIEARLETVDQAHNVALPAAQTPVVRRWLLEEMLPRLDSHRVVWGVSSLDFNGGRPGKTIDAYNRFRATRPGILGEIDRILGEMSALSRYRDQLRDPASFGSLIGIGPAPDRPDYSRVDSDDLLSPPNETEGKARNLERLKTRVRRRTLGNWTIGDEEASAFRATLTELLEREIEVVVILMPVPNSYIVRHPNGEHDFAKFVAHVMGVADDLGVPVFDYSTAHPEWHFYDLTHLNGSPAQRFSEDLAEDLARLGW